MTISVLPKGKELCILYACNDVMFLPTKCLTPDCWYFKQRSNGDKQFPMLTNTDTLTTQCISEQKVNKQAKRDVYEQ